jgi:hypothetical protein
MIGNESLPPGWVKRRVAARAKDLAAYRNAVSDLCEAKGWHWKWRWLNPPGVGETSMDFFFESDTVLFQCEIEIFTVRISQ